LRQAPVEWYEPSSNLLAFFENDAGRSLSGGEKMPPQTMTAYFKERKLGIGGVWRLRCIVWGVVHYLPQ
jgi:hypothetical protein